MCWLEYLAQKLEQERPLHHKMVKSNKKNPKNNNRQADFSWSLNFVTQGHHLTSELLTVITYHVLRLFQRLSLCVSATVII